MNVRVLLLGLGLAAVACSGPSGRTITPTELARLEAQAPRAGSAPAAATGTQLMARDSAGSPSTSSERPGAEAGEPVSRDDIDERAVKLQRRREDHVHALEKLDRTRIQVDLEQEIAEANEQLALDGATHEHAQAREALEHFMGVERDLRLRQSSLELRAAADGLLETREELAQLEMMYGASDLGDATAEIVLLRTRRRLERAELRHRLSEERHAELRDVVLPRERSDLEVELHEKVVKLANARLSQEKGVIEREARRRDLGREELDLQRSLEDIEREAVALGKDRAEWELSLRRGP